MYDHTWEADIIDSVQMRETLTTTSYILIAQKISCL